MRPVDLRRFFQLLKDHWKLILAVTVLAVACSAVLTARMTRLYSSSVTFYVSAQAKAATDPITAYEGSLLSQQEVQSYADLLTGPRLAANVAGSLGQPVTPTQVAAEITAKPVPQTVLVTATVTDPSPARAKQIAATVGTLFVRMVSAIERPPGGGSPPVRVFVVAAPQLPTAPASPDKWKNLGIALGLGLLAGIGIAAARRSLDTSMKTEGQLTAVTDGKPVLGTIPFDNRARKHPLVSEEGPSSRRVEAYRKIATSLRFIDIDTPHKVLLITSPLPEEGKSSTVCNLAIVLAQSGKRVIIVEADFRRPRAAGYLGLPNGAGVTSVLVGTAELQEAIQAWGDDQFAVLTSGPPAPNPSDLLGSRRMSDLLGHLRSAYDVVLVDAPPVLPFADALATAPACDGAIMVVRYGRTRIDGVRKSADALATVGTPLLGSVLSMEPRGKRHSEYGYGYRRYYQPARLRADDEDGGRDSRRRAAVS